MYGTVNQAIQGLVTENFGKDKRDKIKQISGVTQECLISNEPYDDITYELVAAASEVLGLPSEQILRSFGEYWILKTGYERYGELMKAVGENFHDFMVEKINDSELRSHYYSSRSGLTDFVVGLIQGISIMFKVQIEVKWESGEHEQTWHAVFHITILH